MEQDREQRLVAMQGVVNKKYGAGFIGIASQQLRKTVPRIPTGILAVDIATGGGLPAGRCSMLYGEKSGGKTTTLLRWIGNAQKTCSNCLVRRKEKVDKKTGEVEYYCDCKKGYREFVVAFMDAEGAYDQSWGGLNGVNNDKLLYSAPEFAEQCIDITDAWLRSGDIDAVCIDSLAMLVPATEIEESTEKWQQGLQARLLNKATRKWNGALNFSGKKFGRRPTLVMINQLRMKIGIMFGNPETLPGGMGQGFVTSIEVKFWSGPVELEENTKKPLWTTKRFKVEKNKVSPAYQSGEFIIVIAPTEWKKVGDFMDEEYVYVEMERHGLLKFEKEGGNIVLIGENRLNGKGKVVQHWMQNVPDFEEAKRILLEVAR